MTGRDRRVAAVGGILRRDHGMPVLVFRRRWWVAELRDGPGYIIMITALKQRTEFSGLCGSLFDAEEN